MKLVSAARLRRAQDAIVAARPYANALIAAVAEVAARAGRDAHPLMDVRTPATRCPSTRREGTVRRVREQVVRRLAARTGYV